MYKKITNTTLSFLTIIINFFLNIFFPNRCVGCKKEGTSLCFECASKIEKIVTDTCPKCGKIREYGRFCVQCKKNLETPLVGVTIAVAYDEGPTKELVFSLKYLGLSTIAPVLGELIYQKIKGGISTRNAVVVPVPLSFEREKKRGYNQSELIARYLAKKLNIPGGCSLERIRDTKTQVGLSLEMRKENIKGAFFCSDTEFVRNKKVLLIDDVATTFSTLNECARELKKAGAREIWGLVVAKRM